LRRGPTPYNHSRTGVQSMQQLFYAQGALAIAKLPAAGADRHASYARAGEANPTH
jgi:hypothetical protein